MWTTFILWTAAMTVVTKDYLHEERGLCKPYSKLLRDSIAPDAAVFYMCVDENGDTLPSFIFLCAQKKYSWFVRLMLRCVN